MKMVSFIKQGLVIRRLKYMTHRFISDELHGLRELGDSMQKILPPVTQRKHSAHSGRIIGKPIDIPPTRFREHFRKFQSILKLTPNPKDTNGEDKSDATHQREEEVKKLQDLRQRDIDHKFYQESVWKALKERDEVLRRKDDKDPKNENENEEK